MHCRRQLLEFIRNTVVAAAGMLLLCILEDSVNVLGLDTEEQVIGFGLGFGLVLEISRPRLR